MSQLDLTRPAPRRPARRPGRAARARREHRRPGRAGAAPAPRSRGAAGSSSRCRSWRSPPARRSSSRRRKPDDRAGSRPRQASESPPLRRRSIARAAADTLQRERRGREGSVGRRPAAPTRTGSEQDQRRRSSSACRTAQAVSDGTKQAVAIARSLGGYPSALNVERRGSAPGTRTSSCASPSRTSSRRSPALGARDDHRRERRDQGHPGAGRRDDPQDRAALARLAAWEQQAADDADPGAHRRAHRPDRRSSAAAARATIRSASFATVRLDLTTRQAPARRPPRARPVPRARRSPSADRDRRGLRARARRAAPDPARPGWLGVRAVRRHRENALLSSSSFLIWAKTRNVGSPTGSSPNSGLTQPVSSEREA